MKSKKNQRLLALILSMVLMLSASISAMAEGDVQTEASGTETTENQAAVQSLEEETVPETEALTEETDTQSAEILEEPVQESAEQEITEEPAENTETPAETTEPVQEETGEPAETTETDQTIVQSLEVQEESAVTEEQPAETTEEVITEETAVSEAAELKQEFTDENGKVTQTITAYVPEGAFQATADQISMEVSFLNTSDTDYIKGMMEELLPENYYLDGYVLYQIDFKVDGEITQPAKAVTITMSGNDLAVEDTQKAHVFYYDPENPEVEGDKDQLAEVIQKDQLIKSLQESGQSTGNIEDYDYSEIAVNDGNADTITVKGWESTIYGCYVEKEAEPVELKGKAEDIQVTLSGPASSFPQEGELALSVKKVDKETKKIVKEAIEEEAENNGQEVVDYTALDITLLHNGEEIQPLGPVNVTFTKQDREKDAEEVKETKVFHVDEEKGTATDMEAAVNTSGEAEIETTHFSVYVVVDLDQLGGQIELTVQHWATVNQLTGVDGQDGLNITQRGDGIPDNAEATLNSKNIFTRIYTDDTIEMDNQLKKNIEDLSKVLLADAGSTIKNYDLEELWVLKDGMTAGDDTLEDSSEITQEKQKWEIYALDDTDDTEIITLKKNATIRMVYKTVEADSAFSQPVTFYDYNVTWDNTGPENGYIWTDGKMNNRNEETWTGGSKDGKNQLAIGLFNNGFYHDRQDSELNGLKINQGNGDGFTAVKGMVTGVNENGPIYNGIYDKNYFNEIPQEGKEVLKDYSLNFKQVGDVYTLQSVKKGNETTLDNLDKLSEIYDSYVNWTNPPGYRQIFSNNFWPLDQEDYTGIDRKFGGKDFAGASDDRRNTTDNNASDDGKQHNWFFGMRYDFEFTLGDYEGPLNFYFRGDDDFWLFVDGELKTDLGGIHSAIGAMLDLSYLRNGDRNETHKITIIYAERGGHGSTCYMQFTLPNVKPVSFDTDVPKTSVTVEKKWIDHNNPNRPTSIQVELYYKAEDESEWKLYDTQTLTQTNEWKYTWSGLPKDGYTYKVKEVGEEGGKNGNYTVTYQSGNRTDGILDQNTDGTDGSFSGTITNTASPSTWITVKKVWEDNGSAERPDSVDFYLYYRQKGETDWIEYPNGRLTLKKENAAADENTWTGKYENLPVYLGNTDKFLEYTVMEVEGNTPLGQGDKLNGKSTNDLYTVTYPDDHFGTNSSWAAYKAKENQETLKLTVTNSYGVNLEVIKEWKGNAPDENTKIYVGLYKDGKAVEDKYLELSDGKQWKGTFTQLTPSSDYSVKELRPVKEGDTVEFTISETNYTGVGDGEQISLEGGGTYTVSYSELANNTITITNQEIWRLVKRSSSSTEDSPIYLPGAVFDLTHEDGTKYTGTSDDKGIVTWKKGETDFDETFPDGKYTLTEKEAPEGYKPGNSVTFTVTNGVPENLGSGNTGTVEEGILTFYYDNTALYALPSSGGPGIYWYLFGGILLMMAASLIVYKNKRGEVLERK